MNKKLKIIAGEIEMEAELNDTQAAKELWEGLPVEAEANRWGEEIYFEIPLKLKAENTQEVVDMGDIAYWEPGRAFCIFFGKTPVSKGNEIRPASPVMVLGKILGNPKEFTKVKTGEKVTLKTA